MYIHHAHLCTGMHRKYIENHRNTLVEIYKLTLTYIDIQHVTPCNSNTQWSCTMLYMCYHVLINPMRVDELGTLPPCGVLCGTATCSPGQAVMKIALRDTQKIRRAQCSPASQELWGPCDTLCVDVCGTNGIQMNWGFFSIKWQFQHWHTRYLIIIGVHHLDGAFYTQVFWAFPGPLCEFLQFYPIFPYFPLFSPVHQRC